VIEFSEDYPAKPPKVRFVSPIYHPNVYPGKCLRLSHAACSPSSVAPFSSPLLCGWLALLSGDAELGAEFRCWMVDGGVIPRSPLCADDVPRCC